MTKMEYAMKQNSREIEQVEKKIMDSLEAIKRSTERALAAENKAFSTDIPSIACYAAELKMAQEKLELLYQHRQTLEMLAADED
ncbi:MAG: hypothetical protein J6N51_10880 [Selenomonas sp.]|nr:hypothetical protein [Selenomonas sp.]MBP3730982.1 hypothetical protein [Mailhella sp.]